PWEILRAFQRQKSHHTFVNAQTNHAGHDANSGVGFLLSVFAILTCIGLCPLCQLPHLKRALGDFARVPASEISSHFCQRTNQPCRTRCKQWRRLSSVSFCDPDVYRTVPIVPATASQARLGRFCARSSVRNLITLLSTHKPTMPDTMQTVASAFFCQFLRSGRVSDCAHCASYRISSAPWEILRAFQRQKSHHTFVNAQTNDAAHDANSGVTFLLFVFAILTCIGLCPLCQLPHLKRALGDFARVPASEISSHFCQRTNQRCRTRCKQWRRISSVSFCDPDVYRTVPIVPATASQARLGRFCARSSVRNRLTLLSTHKPTMPHTMQTVASAFFCQFLRS